MSRSINSATRVQIIALLSDSMVRATHKELANLFNVSVSTVAKIAKEVKPNIQSAQERYQEYQGHIRRYLPAEFRAKRLRELAGQDEQKMVALKAIQYGDENDDFVTAKAQRKAQEPVTPGPMFIFPVNSRPILMVTPPDAVDVGSGAPEAIEAEAVRVEEDDDAG